MAGLFELQLTSQTRSRRSQDVPELPSNSSSAVRSGSPPPEVTAREIVNQVIAKRDAATATGAGSSSIFPWKRMAMSSRRSLDASPRNSTDTSSSQSPERHRQFSDRMSPRRVTAPVSHSSPRVSSAIDFTLTPSTPDPAGIPPDASQDTKQAHAASALVQAGLGIGLPPIAFPVQSSPISSSTAPRPSSTKRKASARPGTVQGNERASSSILLSKVNNIRRVKSFTKDDGASAPVAVESSTRPSGSKPGDSDGDVLVLTRDRVHSAASRAYSMSEGPSQDVGVKGKGKAPASDPDLALEGPSVVTRGRQSSSTLSLNAGISEHSATRRTSWWSGRRQIDSFPVKSRPHLPSPPPIPQRSQARPGSSGNSTPSLPIFRPFSPLMGEFPKTESPGPSFTSFEDRDPSRERELEDVILSHEEGGPPIQRRHSLNNSTRGTNLHVATISSQSSTRSPSQIHSHSHRYSWTMTLSSSPEHNPSAVLSPSLPVMPRDTSSHGTKSQPVGSNLSLTRRRSMTVNSPPISPPQSPIRESTPLLLRQPVNRPSSSVGPPDPFLTGWGLASGTRASVDLPDGGSLSVLPVEMERTPSTSSGSTSSHSPSVPAMHYPRQRAGTTPPARTVTAINTSTSLPPPSSSGRLLRRLSSTLFNSNSTQGASALENSHPASSSTANLSAVLHSGAGTSSPATSNTSSPRWSKENLPVGDGSRTSVDMRPRQAKPHTRMPDESPEDYVRRLVEAVSKAEVAHVLAMIGDTFHARALRCYVDRFNFVDDPLDVALRKLLMNLGLPRETQQIDRVMEAFASRYVRCNQGLFEHDDHPYILAFSLIMLHTDAFNKSNKNKMTKADYVKNARLPGVPPEVLECFFDNIVFAPFIFIEDPMDVNAPKGYLPEGASRLSSMNVPTTNSPGTVGNATGSTILSKTNKIDPYYLITQGLLGPLRVDVNSHIPRSNPFLFEGTDWPWDTRRLHLLFAIAQVVHIPGDSPPSPTGHNASVSTISTPARRKSIALPSLGGGHGPFIGVSPFNPDVMTSPPRAGLSRGPGPGSIRITKVGILGRKEDLLDGGRRSTNRKWREWSVVLTGSQLLFFRDVNFASQLLELPSPDDIIEAPEMGLLNPDETVSLRECIALFDATYEKYKNTFRFMMPTGRQFLCQAPDERTLNDWISTINYACTFKTAGVSMRGLGMSHKDVEMTGVAAAASHLHDLRTSSKMSAPTKVHVYGSPEAERNVEMSPVRSQTPTPSTRTGSKLLKAFNGAQSQVDLELSVSNHLEGAQQLKVTFDEVKAELAAHDIQRRPSSAGRVRTLSMGARPPPKTPPRPSTTGSSSRSDDIYQSISRHDTIQTYINTWDAKIGNAQNELNKELRIARNLAILTPFQRATRDRIHMTVAQLAKRVRNMRMELAKVTCYRFVLLSDLADEERHLEQAKRDALKAATQRLSTEEGRTIRTVPELHTPFSTSHSRSVPSATESFYSAVDAFEESGNPSTSLSMLSEGDASDFPFLARTSFSASPPRDDVAHTRPPSNPALSDTTSPAVNTGHERFYTAAESPEEIAEEWNETRAAKRVSLVRLPSEVKLSSAFGRQARKPEEGVHLPNDKHVTTSSS